MKKSSLLLAFFLVFLFQSAYGQMEIIKSWEFETPGNAEGWSSTHSLSGFKVSNGTLTTTITGSDPYMIGPGSLRIDASRYWHILIRMRQTHDTNAEFFWTTTTQPDFKAGFEFGFTVVPDSQFHVYEVPVGTSDKWKGTITRLRLDPGEGSAHAVAGKGQVEIDYIRVVHLGPRIELLTFAMDRQVVTAGDTAELTFAIKNTGDEALANATAKLEMEPGVHLVEGAEIRDVPELEAGQTLSLNWKVFTPDTGSYSAAVRLQKADQALLFAETQIQVTPALPAFPPEVSAAAQAWSPFAEHWLLENSRIRLAFIKDRKGYTPIVIFAASPQRWQQVGVIHPPGEITYKAVSGQVQQLQVFPDSAVAENSSDSASVTLLSNYFDVDGTRWQLRYRYRLGNQNPSVVEIRYAAAVDKKVQLLHFSGPIIRAGEGSFGATRQEALFPGLEWLIDAEESSSALDVHSPNDRRYLPHPYKVTVPVMSVSSRPWVIGLSWDPLQKWHATSAYPSPVFASPNSWDGQANHLLGLVAPPVSQWREENAPLASRPYPLAANDSITLSATLFILLNDQPLAGLKWWLDRQGLPALPESPRTYTGDIRLNCSSFMDVLWVPSAKGWHLAEPDPWGTQTNNEIVNQVWLGSLFADDPAKTRQWREQIRDLGQKLASPDPAALGWDFTFRYGELDKSVSALKVWAARHAAGQQADGGWLFQGDPALKNLGETSLGSCSSKAYSLLKAARITGDSFCLERGLAALAFMQQFRVPRGAQVWEVPLHAPDILAAAQAILAYLEGYHVTAEATYLQEAVRWAYAGLPFVYLWAAGDRPIMAYGSIPVFGATWYTGAWFGNIVQWNGLDFAYALQKLWQYDQTLPWKYIAEGLTLCAMQMQRTSETAYPQNKGMYPDAFSAVLGDEAYHWDLAPLKIMQNVLALEGEDPDVSTQVLTTPPGRLHVSSGSPFSAEIAGDVLKIRYQPVIADTAFCLISQIKKPNRVFYEGQDLLQVKDVDKVPAGWSYTIEGDLLIKSFSKTEGSEILISSLALLQKSEEPNWEFDQPDYGDGWTPNYDLDSVHVVNGILIAKSIGGDSWLTSPSMNILAAEYDSFQVRMRTNKGTAAQLFWMTEEAPFYNEGKSFPFTISADGEYHNYSVALNNHAQWKGKVLQFRFDPTNQVAADLAIDYIRLLKKPGNPVGENKYATPPVGFALLPNYPNPFNPETKICYQLPEACHVSLNIYNLLGQQVRMLVDKNQAAGDYTARWDGKDAQGQDLVSGIYVYRMEAGTFVATKKMALIR